jgi:hypothetical protein
LLHKYVYGDVPPVTVMLIAPFNPQVGFVFVFVTVGAFAFVIVVDVTLVQPEPFVMVSA